MRAKFGQSNGLKSGGKMAGIGSDPNYGSGGSNSGSGTDINELGATAFSFVSGWVDTVSKVRIVICSFLCYCMIDSQTHHCALFRRQRSCCRRTRARATRPREAPPTAAARRPTPGPPSPPVRLHDTGLFVSFLLAEIFLAHLTLIPYLCSGAVGFWKQATEVTSDLVNIITKPEEEEDSFRFPRAEGYSDRGAASSTKYSGVGSSSLSNNTASASGGGSTRGVSGSSPAPSSRGSSSNLSTESWDNLDDLQDESPRSQPGRSSAGIAAAEGRHSPSRADPPVARPVSGLNLQQPASGGAAPVRRNVSGTSNASAGANSATSSKRSATPSGEDFFANFGI